MKNSLRKHYEMQNAFTKNQQQTDSIVEHCKKILDMKFHEYHEKKQILIKHRCSMFSNCIFSFLNSQMNDAVFMLQKIIDHIFLTAEYADDSKMIKMINKFQSLKTGEKFIIDTMKLSKTFLILLFVNYYAIHCVNVSCKFFLIFISKNIVLHQ